MRKPFQGVINIILFNWHYYVLALLTITFLLFATGWLPEELEYMAVTIALGILISTFISLAVSTYIYDLSGFYNFDWIQINREEHVLNINAGFDEISEMLKKKFNLSNLLVFDFYDPNKHTELSIRRARKATPPFQGTQRIHTSSFPLEDNTIDKALIIFSAHEIRNDEERAEFFNELHRVLKMGGVAYVTEHLRDVPNFLAYNIGFFHFHTKKKWERTFVASQFKVIEEFGLTPFVTTYMLSKNGNTH